MQTRKKDKAKKETADQDLQQRIAALQKLDGDELEQEVEKAFVSGVVHTCIFFSRQITSH